MSSGKIAAQAGHAYTDALMAAMDSKPHLIDQYRSPGDGGSKVTLRAKSSNELIRAYHQAKHAGIPCAIIVDQHHIHPPHFDGSPIITALGLGPVSRSQAKPITRRFSCL